MTANTVIDAITGWFQPPAVIGLNKLHDADPWFDGNPSWELDGQLGWGASGFVWLVRDEETRISFAGPTAGLKWIVYEAGIVLHFQYLIPTATFDPAVDATGYRRPYYGLCDDLKARLRADRTLGTAPGVSGDGGITIPPQGAIILAGEGDGFGTPDVTITRDLPRRDVGKVWAKILLEFKVAEAIVA